MDNQKWIEEASADLALDLIELGRQTREIESKWGLRLDFQIRPGQRPAGDFCDSPVTDGATRD